MSVEVSMRITNNNSKLYLANWWQEAQNFELIKQIMLDSIQNLFFCFKRERNTNKVKNFTQTHDYLLETILKM